MVAPSALTVHWKTDLGAIGTAYTGPVIAADGTVYVAHPNGTLFAVAPDGKIVWQTTIATGNSFAAPSIGADGTIYVGTYDYLYAVAPNGIPIWSVPSEPVATSPAIGCDGSIYVGTHYAVPGSPQGAPLSAYSKDGKLLWKIPSQSGISSLAIDETNSLYVTTFDWHLFRVSTAGVPAWAFTASGPLRAVAVGDDGSIFAHEGDKQKLWAVTPAGAKLWETPPVLTGNSYSGIAIAADGTVVVDSDGLRGFHPLDGAPAFVDSFADPTGPLGAIGGDGTIYVGLGYSLAAVLPNGTVASSIATKSWLQAKPAIGADGTVYAMSEDGHLYALGL